MRRASGAFFNARTTGSARPVTASAQCAWAVGSRIVTPGVVRHAAVQIGIRRGTLGRERPSGCAAKRSIGDQR